MSDLATIVPQIPAMRRATIPVWPGPIIVLVFVSCQRGGWKRLSVTTNKRHFIKVVKLNEKIQTFWHAILFVWVPRTSTTSYCKDLSFSYYSYYSLMLQICQTCSNGLNLCSLMNGHDSSLRIFPGHRVKYVYVCTFIIRIRSSLVPPTFGDIWPFV